MNTYESIKVGESYSTTHFISIDDVRTFAEVTGDHNPIHVDHEYADNSRYGKPIVHGVLLMGIVSKVIGHEFPGHGSVAVSLSCRFLRPVPVDSEITVEVKVFKKIVKHQHIKMRVYVYTACRMALSGEAVLIPPSDDKDKITNSKDRA